jgi:cytoskeletal protein CcmA (bactofilin family)
MGGLDDAIAQLKASSSFTGYSSRSFGAGTVSVSVTTPASSSTRRIIVSTGTVTGMNYTYAKSVRATLDTGGISSIFYDALAAKTSFTINGNVNTDSTPTAHAGSVHCNQDVILKGSSMTIDGNVTASGTVDTSGHPNVTGSMTSGAPTMTFPEIDAAFESQALVNGSRTGNVTVSDGSLIKGKINGNLTISGSGCQISGVVWVTGSLSVQARVTGTGTVVCDGIMTLGANNSYPQTDVSNLLWATTNIGTVDLGGNAGFKGIVYAPYGTIWLHGTPTLFGGAMANAVTFSGTPNITKWTDFDQSPPTFPSAFKLYGWEEL